MGGSNSSMNMPGMSTGGAGSDPAAVMSHAASSHDAMAGMAMSHASAAHGAVNLLPEWGGILGTILFVLVAVSHVHHLATTGGERDAVACVSRADGGRDGVHVRAVIPARAGDPGAVTGSWYSPRRHCFPGYGRWAAEVVRRT